MSAQDEDRSWLRIERVRGGFIVSNAYKKPRELFAPSTLFPKGRLQESVSNPTTDIKDDDIK